MNVICVVLFMILHDVVLTRGKPGPVKLPFGTLLCCVLGTHTLYRIKLLSSIELILRERHRSLLHPHYFPITFDR